MMVVLMDTTITHWFVRSSSGGCQSKLRVLRAASTHFPVLRHFLDKLETLLSNDVDSSYEQSTDVISAIRQPSLETQPFITHAGQIVELEKEIDDFPEYVCCSCERLHQKKSLTVVKLSAVICWPRLKSFTLQQTPDADVYMCINP